MNANGLVVAGVIVVILAIGGLILYTGQSASPPAVATSPPVSTSPTDVTPTPSAEPQAGVPGFVTGSSVAPSDTTAVVTGRVTPNGAFTSYWYEYGTTASFGNKTAGQTIGSGWAAIPAPGYITGLVKDTTYYFRLVGENQFGRVAGTQYSFRTTLNTPPPVGSAPTVRTTAGNGISRTSANLNGQVTPNRAMTQFWFEYGKSPNLGQTSALVSVGDGTAVVPASLSLSALDPLTTYYFRLNAQNQFGTINGAILNFKTAGPAAGSAPSATTRNASSVNETSATLRGSVDPNGLETTYWFEYSSDSLLGSVLTKTTAQKSAGAGNTPVAVEEDISGLNGKTTYYFRLVAQSSAGMVRSERGSFKTD